MIVRFLPSGRSFKWLGQYLVHDPKAETAERVAWTHTLNLAHDDVASAIHEMLATYHNRDLLKIEAGVRRGGAKLEKPVKHLSLNWHPSERPTRDHMIAVARSFLKEMGWQDHQCVLVAHHDKDHRHVHLMINAVHPTLGTRLNDGFERRRAQAWALHYEKAMGKVFCEERLKPVQERDPSPPRNAWERLRDMPGPDAEPAEATSDEAQGARSQWGWKAQEWRQIKKLQKEERVEFFAAGKKAYRDARNQAYRDIRGQYRKEWAEFYQKTRSGLAAAELADLRADLVDRQSASLDDRRKSAAEELRARRDADYRALLDRQQQERAQLLDRQERGLRSPDLWARRKPSPEAAPASDTAAGEDAHRKPRANSRIVSEAPALWTDDAGMVAQQRSAMRWLKRAEDRIDRAPQRHGSDPPDWLAMARMRAAERQRARSGSRQQDKGVEVDAEPEP
jgi:hypothetical protein